MRASILSSSTSVAKDNINATVEWTSFFFALEALTTVKWRDAFEREGFSSCIVAIAVDEAHCCVKVVSLYPMDLVNFRIIFNTHAS